MNHRPRQAGHPCPGFTLVEILVVIGIVALLAGFIVLGLTRERRTANVRADAMQLVATLRKARDLAIGTGSVHGVAFHLQNAPGSSGAVLNNRSGGHWYRIIGPSLTSRADGPGVSVNREGALYGRTPMAQDANLLNFGAYVHAVSRSWIGEPIRLKPGHVRFLALGDVDEGLLLRNLSGSSSGSDTRRYGDAGDTTYPRPWFGYFDTATGRLWPWGGYDPGKPWSGFYYHGADGPIPDSREVSDRIYREDQNRNGAFDPAQDLNGDGDIDDLGEDENQIILWRAGDPRPLVNAHWLDAQILFLPSGRAIFPEWNRARRAYLDVQADVYLAPFGSTAGKFRNGVSDRAKRGLVSSGIPYPFDRPERDPHPYDQGEVAHFLKHTGGWHVTLAPDVSVERTQFPSAQEALKTMTPMWRVRVDAFGGVSAFLVQVRPGYLHGKPVWPSHPDDWLSGSLVWTHARMGWLRTPTGTPRGRPITDVVDPDMLSRRVWWIDD